MSEFSGVFDQLADALKAAGASPSTTLRHQRASRQPFRQPQVQTQTFASRAIPTEPVAPPSPRRRKERKEIDRSRDHAVYAAPHRPIRPHAYSRPDDITTERVLRQAIATASEARRGVPVALIAFAVTLLAGAGAFFFVR